MIVIGLTGWGDHDSLYAPGTAAKDKLKVYARHFAIVEMDSRYGDGYGLLLEFMWVK